MRHHGPSRSENHEDLSKYETDVRHVDTNHFAVGISDVEAWFARLIALYVEVDQLDAPRVEAGILMRGECIPFDCCQLSLEVLRDPETGVQE